MTAGNRYLAATVPSVDTLSWGKALAAAAVLAGAAMLAGVIVIAGRKLFAGKAGQPQGGTQGQTTSPDSDFIRSWIAITLVIGLISFCAFAFAVNDTTLRSTLIGGLIASVGSAIAFYFSSKSADQARQDVANAAAGTEMVPSLIGQRGDEAAQALGKTTFRLVERPGSPPGDSVTEQHPSANAYAPRGSSVLVTLGAPRPPA